MLVLSLFFVGEAGKMAAWVLRDEPNAPNPESGVFLSRACSLVVLILWFFYVIMLDVVEFGRAHDDQEMARRIVSFITRPIRLVPGFLVASVLPSLVAVLKWGTAFSAGSPTSATRDGAKPWKMALVQMMTSLLSIAASVFAILKLLKQ